MNEEFSVGIAVSQVTHFSTYAAKIKISVLATRRGGASRVFGLPRRKAARSQTQEKGQKPRAVGAPPFIRTQYFNKRR